MSFFRRMFSLDYRAAVAAEASGDLTLAAERYALAGQYEDAARMHLVLSERANNHANQVTSLRDALHWAANSDNQQLRRQISKNLGQVLLDQSQSEGIATARDRNRVREAATLLALAEQWLDSGKAWQLIGEHRAAAEAFGRGGHVDHLEEVLTEEQTVSDRQRKIHTSFADYKLHLRAGDRDSAHRSLLMCLEAAENPAKYQRLLDELQSRIITRGTITLSIAQKSAITLCAGTRIGLGRDPMCEISPSGPGHLPPPRRNPHSKRKRNPSISHQRRQLTQWNYYRRNAHRRPGSAPRLG